jgi:hypothetical protein
MPRVARWGKRALLGRAQAPMFDPRRKAPRWNKSAHNPGEKSAKMWTTRYTIIAAQK